MTGRIDDFDAEIDAAHEEIFDLCARLVAADSVNPPGHTHRVADEVAAWLRDRGAPVAMPECVPHKPNVVSQVRGHAPGRHVVFNAHMDTMPPGDESLWSVAPFELTRRDGRAYGLGLGNMKGALAVMCFVTVLMQRHSADLPGRLSMTAVSDEIMFGKGGTVFLLDQFPDLQGDFLVSGEGPGFMNLAVAEKGLVWLDIEVSAAGGHSSSVRTGETAAVVLAKLLVELDRLNDHFASPPPELPGVSGGVGNQGYRLSANVGSMQSGDVRSQIATSASACLDIRLPPGLTLEEVEAIARQNVPEGTAIRINRVQGWNANWTGVDHPLVRAAHEAATAIRGTSPDLVVRLPASDARNWRDLGTPAICYGPQPTLSAGIDDHVFEQDLIDCAKLYARVALKLMRP